LSTAPAAKVKPLGGPAYGSIPHLPGSKRGPGDHGVNEGQARIATVKARDDKDTIIVLEKLDGTCVAAWRDGNTIVPLIRAGYHARTSPREMHHLWADYVDTWKDRFLLVLKPGQRLVGEWLAQAHGVLYPTDYLGVPFTPFDIIDPNGERLPHKEFLSIVGQYFWPPCFVRQGPADPSVTIHRLRGMISVLTMNTEPYEPEGLIYRVERNGKVDFMCKWVRPDFEPGKYLPEISGKDPVWNWRPDL